MQEELAKCQQYWQQKFKEISTGAQEFDTWDEGLRNSTKDHLDALTEKSPQLILENDFMMNQMTGLIELEEMTRKKHGFSGLLVTENDLDTLKHEVHEYTKDL